MDRGVDSEERRLQHKQLQACLNVATHHSRPAWKQIHRLGINLTTDDNMQQQCRNDNLWAHYSPCSSLINLVYTDVQC